jgi:HEAT repeat protein
MLTDERTAAEYLGEVRYGGWSRQWPAAYELSRLMEDPQVRADRSLVPELVKAFDEAKDGDPRIRRYLALAIGRLEPPLPKEAIDVLVKALDEPGLQWTPDIVSRLNGWADIDINEARIMTIWALGSSGDASVVARLVPFYESKDAGIRKMVVYALGALPGEAQLSTLTTALKDEAPDVRWNAAIALARHDSAEGVPVLREMLDRAFVEQTVKRDVRQYEDQDPVADVMISGLRAAAALNDPSLKASVEGLSQQDRSLRVRQAALEALKTMG